MCTRFSYSESINTQNNNVVMAKRSTKNCSFVIQHFLENFLCFTLFLKLPCLTNEVQLSTSFINLNKKN